MSDFRMRQYVYFSVSSQSLSCEKIEKLIGLQADKHEVFGKERHKADPSFQVTNSWRIDPIRTNVRVDDQIKSLLDRLRPAKSALIKLSKLEHINVTIEVIRYFDNTWGEEEELVEVDGLVKLPGQHQLLGWNLDLETIEFLHAIKAELDIDEYN